MNSNSKTPSLVRILFVSPHLELGKTGGPALRTHQTVNTLAELSELQFYDLDLGPKGEPSPTKKGRLASTLLDLLNPNTTRIGQLLQIVFGLWTITCSNDVLRTIEATKPDMVWINFVNEHSFLVRKIKSKYPDLAVIGDTDSVYSVFLRRTSLEMRFFRRIAYAVLAILQGQREKRLAMNLDVMTAVSDYDKRHYEALGGSASVRLFANVIYVPNEIPDMSKRGKTMKLLLPGTFGGPESAMTHGLGWFCNEVWPIIRRSLPLAELSVVGRNADFAIRGPMADGVTVVSDVPEMRPFFEEARVVICPLFFESGTRFKILEAAKYQVPVVSTSLGAEGLDFANELEILIADDTNSFASSCLSLLTDDEFAQKIGVAARRRLEIAYSHNSSRRQALRIIEEAYRSEVGK